MRSLTNRCEMTLAAWRADAARPARRRRPGVRRTGSQVAKRSQAREMDVGMFRHYLDPTEPFVNAVIKPSHGAVITSATLRDILGVPPTASIR